MKHLRFAAFLSLIVLLIVLLSPTSSGQSSPATKPSLSLAQPGVLSGGQPDGSWRNPVLGRAVVTCDQFNIEGCVQRTITNSKKILPLRDTLQRPNLNMDRGIFLGRGAGDFCGSIISYNFSPGDNPELQSITTCTPRGSITTYRAKGKQEAPHAPMFQTTEYPTRPR